MSKSIFFVTGIALLFSSSILPAEESERPNIIWIIAEDMSPDLGCYGNQVVTTPNIDGLAVKGMQFNNVFTTSPACSPSRTALATCIPNNSWCPSHALQQGTHAYPSPTGENITSIDG